MKVAKVVLSVLIVAAVVFGMVACTDKTGGGPGGDPNKSGTTLTPSSITYLKDITNYGQESRYYAAAAVTYADTTEETKKLQTVSTRRKPISKAARIPVPLPRFLLIPLPTA